MSTLRLPGTLLVLRLNTADDFFISAKDRSRSSSLSLSLSYKTKHDYQGFPHKEYTDWHTCLKNTLTVSVTGQKF